MVILVLFVVVVIVMLSLGFDFGNRGCSILFDLVYIILARAR